MLLDTSVGTSNVGDFIIMECVRKELAPLLENSFVYNLPTHLPAFNGLAVWKNSLSVQRYSECDLKFAGGSNLLVKNLLTHYPQWNISPFNSKPLKGVITVGVGAGRGKNSEVNFFTKWLYKRILNHEFYHSVRDERSKLFMESLELKAINTGCVTMWMLTPEFCETIPTRKTERVVFTLTAKALDASVDERDQATIDILKRNYREINFWVQGDEDMMYFEKFKNTDGIRIIPPNKNAYDALLTNNDIDYVGTRLHGGIYAMRHRRRAIIIAIDERASAINKSNHLNCLRRRDVPEQLESMIQSEFHTDIKMDFDAIQRWKTQFNGRF